MNSGLVAFVVMLLSAASPPQECEDCWTSACEDLRGVVPQCKTKKEDTRPAGAPLSSARVRPSAATLLIIADEPCSLEVDGAPAGNAAPRKPRRVDVALGTHLVVARARDGVEWTWEDEVETIGQVLVKVDLDGTRREAAEEASDSIAERAKSAAARQGWLGLWKATCIGFANPDGDYVDVHVVIFDVRVTDNTCDVLKRSGFELRHNARTGRSPLGKVEKSRPDHLGCIVESPTLIRIGYGAYGVIVKPPNKGAEVRFNHYQLGDQTCSLSKNVDQSWDELQ